MWKGNMKYEVNIADEGLKDQTALIRQWSNYGVNIKAQSTGLGHITVTAAFLWVVAAGYYTQILAFAPFQTL